MRQEDSRYLIKIRALRTRRMRCKLESPVARHSATRCTNSNHNMNPKALLNEQMLLDVKLLRHCEIIRFTHIKHLEARLEYR